MQWDGKKPLEKNGPVVPWTPSVGPWGLIRALRAVEVSPNPGPTLLSGSASPRQHTPLKVSLSIGTTAIADQCDQMVS